MQISYHLFRMFLAGWLCLALGLSLTTGRARATTTQEEGTPAADRAFLLEQKANEWQIVRELGLLTAAPDTQFLPTYDTLPFTVKADGKVSVEDVTYDRYVEVSSAAELTRALAKAEAGDFIHLLDGLYPDNFAIERSGLTDKPIALYGSRQAVLDGQSLESGYGLHLMADHWLLMGFTIRNAAKGLMTDGANHNLIRGLELYQIGDEALHLRTFSSHNRIEKLWIHDTGLVNPVYGEGVYIGSAVSNWPTYTEDKPDRSDNNLVIGNVLGPHLTAEGVDLKEGTTGGAVQNNTFLTDDKLMADSWIDIKGNDYTVSRNLGAYYTGSKFRMAVDLQQPAVGWGQNNAVYENQAFGIHDTTPKPFFVTTTSATEQVRKSFTKSAYLILPARPLPYTLSEIAAYFPASVQSLGPATLFLQENILVGRNAALQITTDDAARVRMLSTPERFVTINSVLGQITIKGAPELRLDFEAWDAVNAQPDLTREDGRSYILAVGSRMDIDYAGFFDLGYEEGTVSGVAWKSLAIDGGSVLGRGDVSHSHFIRNYFGAYTFEAVEMHWIANTFANNIKYGFDPHDFSNYFLTEDNLAYGNGSHGIIFSRGCDYNILRRNKSYDNVGHGIMIDDGKVIPDGDNVRYLAAVPSNHNVIEDNFIANNQDGIVLEGGASNVIRNNLIMGPHRYGVRLKDDVRDTVVVSNTIEHSDRLAIFVYNHSTNNRFQHNTITTTPGGVGLQDAPGNTIIDNRMNNIRGAALVLKGDLSNSVIANNTFVGSGSQPLRTEAARGVDLEAVRKANDLSQWRHQLPTIVPTMVLGSWSLIFFVPIFMTLRRILLRK
ncbi:MAG: right-handed parallel beta-helix repeat-containing protein [Caldilineaceae bacterium]